MGMEFVTTTAGYTEAEQFAAGQPLGSFMQSPRWAAMKPAWDSHMVVSRGSDGALRGSMLVLSLQDRGDGQALLYAPRGPVYAPGDAEALAELLQGAQELARQFGHGVFKCDPLIPADDRENIRLLEAVGLHRSTDEPSVQPCQNAVRRGLAGLTPQQLLESFSAKTQFYIRSAAQHGAECTVGSIDDLAGFYRIYSAMGQRKGFGIRPESYFHAMLTAFGDDARLYLCRKDDTLLAGAIVIAFGGRASYVYGASDRTQPELAVGYRLQWEMLCFAL